MLHVTEVRYVRDLIVWIAFDDGESGDVDLSERPRGRSLQPAA